MKRAVSPSLSGLGIRARLTVLYGGMFLLAGTALIAILYVLFKGSYPGGKAVANILSGAESPGPHAVIHLRSGARLTLPDVAGIRHKFDHHRARALKILVKECLVALAGLTIVAGAFGWVMAGRALSPVRRITQTARRAADGNLRERIGLAGPADEVKELADTFDVMLERLDASFEGQRQFAAHASHELRTPLATNRTVLEVALASGRVPAEMRDLVDTVLLTNARSELIIDGLLMLARSESQAITRVPVDLSDVAADAVEQTAEEAAAARITVDATPDPAGTVGDPLLLEHLALNLVRNGLRHNHPGGWVTVATTARPQSGEAELVVTNSGPVVPPEHIGALFEPFRRLGNGRDSGRDGIGLGLSIVRSVVRAHGGRVRAEPRDDGGLIVRVSLPATSRTVSNQLDLFQAG
jgi:signal transduction histidine kinase